jgi:hypothetical protein
MIKPAFFEYFRKERASLESIKSAAAHIASHSMASGDWAGLQSSSVMITETIPMMAKLQSHKRGECVGSSPRLIDRRPKCNA